MRSLILFFSLCVTGCTDKPLLIDCRNGYHVQPPLACPDSGLKVIQK